MCSSDLGRVRESERGQEKEKDLCMVRVRKLAGKLVKSRDRSAELYI